MADLKQCYFIGRSIGKSTKQLRLKCDGNYTSFCVTAHKYDQSTFNCDKVKWHLLNQGKYYIRYTRVPMWHSRHV